MSINLKNMSEDELYKLFTNSREELNSRTCKKCGLNSLNCLMYNNKRCSLCGVRDCRNVLQICNVCIEKDNVGLKIDYHGNIMNNKDELVERNTTVCIMYNDKILCRFRNILLKENDNVLKKLIFEKDLRNIMKSPIHKKSIFEYYKINDN